MSFQHIILGLLVVGEMACLSNVYAYDFFAEDNADDETDLEINFENTGLNLEQKQLAQQHDEQENNYKVLKNLFYSNEKISIYNYTAYNVDHLKNKIIDGSSIDQIGLNDLSISFGYGLVYNMDGQNRVGYEYISSFPYNRSQLIRIFWIWSF
ncbi:hypothetical protein KTH71_07815 [Acinetobacter sp. WU_MDCI_Axc73]|nr:hypothetical protein [Acinetobacter sp. WU_MDCI_Axc73]